MEAFLTHPLALPLLLLAVNWGIVKSEVGSLRREFEKWENRVFQNLMEKK